MAPVCTPRLPAARPAAASPQARARTPVMPARAGLALLALMAALALAGCGTLPTISIGGIGGGGDEAGRALAAVPAEPLAKARELARGGKPAKAAEQYLELAGKATPPARAQLQFLAVDALLAAGDGDQANKVLGEVDKGSLTGAQRQQLLLTEADVALQRGRAADATTRLKQVNPRGLAAPQRAQYYGTLAAAERLSGNPLAAAEALDARDRLLSDPAARLDNQVSLLFTLTALGKSGLAEAARETRGRLRGWVELASVVSGFGAPGPDLDAAVRQWRQGRGTHPALRDLPRAYFTALAGGYPAGAKAMVLLPRGGAFGAPAQAIRDGIEAAHSADSGATRPQLDFRDTAGAIGPRYDGGVEAGATLAIGPLQREDVTALARRASLPVPTLALNRTGGGVTGNLFQFALAPEDEAISAANHAWAAGLRKAALLSPKDPWGERMADAFRGQWRTLGGTLVIEQAYTPEQPNYDQSVAKVRDAGAADVIFLIAAGPDVGHLWTSLTGAGNRLPVIATSHVYDGDADPDRDAALAGLYFVDIPWLLEAGRSDSLSRKALRDRLPNVNGPLARLYAMGIDAYRLAPRIADMGRSPGMFFPGSTGGLTVDGVGQLRRQLALARFSASGPRPVPVIEPAAAGKDRQADAEKSDDAGDKDTQGASKDDKGPAAAAKPADQAGD